LNLSDREDAKSFREKNKTSKKERRVRGARQYRQEIDTNVFKINFSTLIDKAEIATGDPNFCKKCQACLNLNSVIEESKDPDTGEEC